MTIRGLAAGAVLVALAGSTALAGTIRVRGSAVNGDAFILQAGNFDPDVFGAPPGFGTSVLEFIHDELNGDGVVTNDFVTIVAANTTHGLALFALFDDEVDGPGPVITTAEVDYGSKVFNSSGIPGIQSWQNDAGELTLVNPGPNPLEHSGTFEWDPDIHGDAFAISGLHRYDNGVMDFTHLSSLIGSTAGFQYVSWTGSSWSVIGNGNWDEVNPVISNGSFTWDVIPLPSGGGLACAGLLIVAARRRRI